MSEQPPRVAPAATTAAKVLVLAGDDIVVSLRQIEHMSGIRPLSPCLGPKIPARKFGFAGKEEVGIIARHGVVERSLDRIAGPRRAHQTRRNDDGEVGLVLLEGPARKQRSEDWYITQPGQLFLIGLVHVLQEPADGEALTIAKLDGGAGAAHDQRRDRRPLDRDLI